MASYEDTVNALSPVLFHRLNEVGGTVMSDASTFNTPGTFYAPVFGQPSPIETDPASFAMSGSVGKTTIADAPQADARTNFTWIVWGFTTGGFSQVSHLITRNGQIGLNGGNWLAIDDTQARFHLFNGSDWELDYTLVNDNRFYFLAGVRNGTVMQFYADDGELVAQRSDIGTADIGVGTSTAWYFGSSQNQNLWLSAGMDEPAIFDYPLTQAEIRAVYEAAINAILMNGRSDVVPSAVLYSDVEPPPISFPFRHNWDSPLIERLMWRTAISRSRSGVEEGCATRRAPRREFEFVQVLKSNTERRRFRHQLNVGQRSKWWVPVRRDAELLQVPLTAGAVTIPVTTSLRDYTVGGYVQLRQLDDSGAISHWEEVLVEGLNGGVQATITNDYSVGALVQPVRRAFIDTSLSIKGHTAEVEETTIIARLLPEDELDQPPSITVWHPTLKYRDYEVFDPAVWQASNWDDAAEYEVPRAVDEVDFDTGLISLESDTSAAEETFTYRMLLQGRDDIAAFLGWFYERAGSLTYLWVASQQRDYEPLNARTTDLQVVDTLWTDNFAGLEHRRDLAFVYNDNTMVARRIVGVRGAVDEILELDAAVPSLSNLRSVSQLKFCRLESDALELGWHTDDKVVVSFRFHELLHSPEGVGLSSLSPSVSLSPSRSPSASQSPSASASASVSPSSSASPSVSPSHSVSPSSSQSPSASVSPSISESPSVSPSHSVSPSSSTSPSLSPSASASPSSSVSPSVSPSSSQSPSPSTSPSVSPSSSASPSVSPSHSVSPSASISPSVSPSASTSPSSSASPSGAPFTLIAHSKGTGNSGGATTSAVDTTGADLLIVGVSWFGVTLVAGDLTDNKGNSFSILSQAGGAGARSVIYYCRGGTVGSGHTFTLSHALSFPSLTMLAFGGSVASPFDVENGASNSSGTTRATGSITPNHNNEIIVSVLGTDNAGSVPTIDSSMTREEDNPFGSGVNMAGAIAWKQQTTAAAINPTWSWTNSVSNAAVIASFRSE